jgi:hypothetical protein
MAAANDSTTTPADEWLNLWQFAMSFAPRFCFLAAWWLSNPPMTPTGDVRAQTNLMATDPTVMNEIERIKSRLRHGDSVEQALAVVWANPDCARLLRQELERRLEKRRSMGRYLMFRLSVTVRKRLASGGYEVRARTRDGNLVSLEGRDLVGLDVDFIQSALIGDGGVFGSVRVRRILPMPSQTAVAHTSRDAALMEVFLHRLMTDNPQSPMTKADARKAAVASGLGDVSNRAFGRAWANAVQSSGASRWSTPGNRRRRAK